MRLMRRLLDWLARRWDAAEAAAVAQREARRYRRAYRVSERGRQRERRDYAEAMSRDAATMEDLTERLREARHDGNLKQARIEVLESQLEFSAMYAEVNRAILETDLAKLGAERAAEKKRASSTEAADRR